MNIAITAAAIAFVALAWFAGPAAAQSSCTQFSIPAMDLGAYTGSLSTSGSVTGSLTCPANSAYNIGLDQGTGAGATTTSRELTSGSSTLTYQLFQNSALTTNWGGTGSSGVEAGTGSGATQSFSIYPRIAAGQTPIPGVYSDTITAAVSDDGTSTTTFTVTANVPTSCAITATDMAFGAYSGVALSSTATLTVTCTNSTPYNVGLSAGDGNAATVTSRLMSGPDANGLKYALLQDAAHTVNWGNTVGTDTLAGTGSGSAQALTVYGVVAAGQNIEPGSYTDTIIATLTY
jgi:spore coat protein U-like protein